MRILMLLSAALLATAPAQAGAAAGGKFVAITPQGSAPPRVGCTARDQATGSGDVASRGGPDAALPSALAGTRWRLVEFQSMDDRQGTKRPHDASLYTMQLGADGSVQMQLNCNRAQGKWSAEAAADRTSGRFRFGPLAATRALCPPPSMDEILIAQAPYVRGYLLKDGRLYLSLMADGGISAWEPDPAAVAPAKGAAEGGPRAWRPAVAGSAAALRAAPSLRGGPRGYLPARSLAPATAPDGTVPTGADDSAPRAGGGCPALLTHLRQMPGPRRVDSRTHPLAA